MRASDKNLQQRAEASASREYRVNRSTHSIPCKCACAVWVPMRAAQRPAPQGRPCALTTEMVMARWPMAALLALSGVEDDPRARPSTDGWKVASAGRSEPARACLGAVAACATEPTRCVGHFFPIVGECRCPRGRARHLRRAKTAESTNPSKLESTRPSDGAGRPTISRWKALDERLNLRQAGWVLHDFQSISERALHGL